MNAKIWLLLIPDLKPASISQIANKSVQSAPEPCRVTILANYVFFCCASLQLARKLQPA